MVVISAAAFASAASALAQQWESDRTSRADRAELQVFPNGPWVKPLTLGRARLVADAAWLQAIQYYGEHRKTDRRYPYAGTLFQTLTGLDPAFENAYVLGALILSEDAGHFDQAVQLLVEGVNANPESWRLPFELGFLFYRHGLDRGTGVSPDAVRWLAHAGRQAGAPPSVRRLAAFAAQRSGARELSIALWIESLRASENAEVRRIAEEHLVQLGVPPAELEGVDRTPEESR